MTAGTLRSFLPAAPVYSANDPLARVAELDARQRHGEAVDILAREARRDDLRAMTALAKRLVLGDRAPYLPRDGARFLAEAAGKGCGEAATQLSVFLALGLHLRQSWQGALDMVIRGAELGWKPAQGQLLALAHDGDLVNRALRQRFDACAWRQVGNGVDLGFWLAAAGGETLSEDPLIRRIPGFLSTGVCEWLIELARGKLKRARVYSSVDKSTTVSPERSNTCAVFDLGGTDLVNLLVQARIAATLGTRISHLEAATVLHYDVGEQITPHYDFIHPRSPDYEKQVARSGQRRITFLAYLNDDYEGGETDFPELKLCNAGVRGCALYFVNVGKQDQGDPRTLHAGRPPTRGEKWILSQFVRTSPVIGVAV